MKHQSAAIAAAVKNKGIKNSGFAKDFLLSINYVGIGRFAFACVADSKYIADDFKKAYKEFIANHKKKQFEEAVNIPGLGCLILNDVQA